MDRKVEIVNDENGKLVLIHDICFKGKRNINWKEVEKYLIRYISCFCEVTETKDIIYLGKDFTNEFPYSVYTKNLKGGLAKAKANLTQGILELILIATNRRWNEDFESRHKKKAKRGWYRYNTRFAIPITDSNEKKIGYNIFKAVLIVRCASDGKLYLYDIQNIKKESSKPL